MTTTSFTEGPYPGEFIIGEGEGRYSRETVTLASGNNLVAGAVLGKVTTGSGTAQAGTNTGNGAMGAITVGSGALAGVYTLRITEAAANAGTFEVIDPEGDVCGIGTVAVAFSGGGLSFTLADGGTDFVVGDSFLLTVTTSDKYHEFDPAGTDGTQIAVAILYAAVDATSADAAAVIVARLAEVDSAALTWISGATEAQKTQGIAQLARAGIIAR